jgi:predicted ribosomally synthesized peptide with nif11-like leader
MGKMKELYEKVAADSSLQSKFAEIMKDAEKADKEEKEKKLLAFAKEAGYVLSIEEVIDFLEKLKSKETGELTDTELDMVAGGKTFTFGSGGPSRGNHFL